MKSDVLVIDDIKKKAEQFQTTFETLNSAIDGEIFQYQKKAGDLPSNCICYTENDVRKIISETLGLFAGITLECYRNRL